MTNKNKMLMSAMVKGLSMFNGAKDSSSRPKRDKKKAKAAKTSRKRNR